MSAVIDAASRENLPPSGGRSTSTWEPLGVTPDPLSPERARQLVWALIALGIAARLVRYWLRFPLWQDEAYLAASFLDRDFVGLMGPLENLQVAPLGYLWIELAFLKVLGFTEYSLRLFPLLCGVGSLLVFRHVASRLLRGTALVLAVGFLAASYPAIRYSVEAKQYSSDMFASMVLVALAVEWWRRPEQSRWLWALVVAAPLAVTLSYPAVFVAGGVSLAVAGRLWQLRSRRGWAAWVGYNVLLLIGVAAVYWLSAASQSSNSREFLVGLWQQIYPPLGEPLKLLGWLVMVHTSEMFSYPIGGAHGAGVLTFLCCVVATVLLFRRGHWVLAVLLLTPFALNFLSACLTLYPYGGTFRFSIHLTPIVCLLGGLGAAVVMVGAGRRPAATQGSLVAVLLLLSGLGVGSIVRDIFKPYKSTEVLRCRDVARSLWQDRAGQEELVCVRTDLGEDFSTQDVPVVWALYLCNQRIYSARHAEHQTPHFDQVSDSRPLSCIDFRSPAERRNRALVDRWLKEMKDRYVLVGCEKYPVPVQYDTRPLAESIDVYRFKPRTGYSAAGVSQAAAPGATRR